MFGGLLVGIIVPHDNGFAIAMTDKLEDLVTILFAPLYFVYAGYLVNLPDLIDQFTWLYTILILIISLVGKIGGCALAGKLFSKLTVRESLAVGILMNTRGMLEVIVLNIGLEAGIINQKLYTMLMVMSLVNTVVTVPVLKYVYPLVGLREDNLEKGSSKPGNAPETNVENPLNILVCLSSLQYVEPMMFLNQMIVDSGRKIKIVALRLVGLGDRMSAVMMGNDSAITIQKDAAINIFRTFGQLNNINLQTLLTVTNKDNFANDILEAAQVMGTDLIICPIQYSKNVYPKGWATIMFQSLVENPPCTVGILLNRGFGKRADLIDTVTNSEFKESRHLIIFIFQGTDDDLEACAIVNHLANQDTHDIIIHCLIDFSNNSVHKQGMEALGTFPCVEIIYHLPNAKPIDLIALMANLVNQDLIIIGHALYGNDSSISSFRFWVDNVSHSSILVIKKPSKQTGQKHVFVRKPSKAASIH